MKFLSKLAVGILGMLSIYTFCNSNVFKINRVRVQTRKFPLNGKVQILQISDMHNKRAWGLHKRLLYKIDKLHPDMIVLTGDLVDRKTKDFRKIFTFIDMLAATKIPIFFVTGNHEWGNSKNKQFLTGLENRGVIILSNKAVELELNSVKVTLVGIDDTSTEHENIPEAFRHVKNDAYMILLSHSPYVIKKYPYLPVDLVLSGHTHGGQIRFPIIGAVISPGGGLFPELDKGLFQWGRDKYIYVDSGLGTSTIPIRFLNQSQMSIIQIERDN